MSGTFGNFVESLNGKYITAEDVGMSVHDMEFIRMETNHVTGIKRAMGGSGDPSILTALGVFVGMQAALKKKLSITSMRDLKVGIQGFGKVGYHLCSHLHKEGAIIYGYDIDKSKLDTVVNEFGVIPLSNEELISTDLDVFSQNLETVDRLTSLVRDPRAGYNQTLQILEYTRNKGFITKSGMMLGLGETYEEVEQAMIDLYNSGIEILTLGQYLRPTKNHLPVKEYITPQKFQEYENLKALLPNLGDLLRLL